MWGYPTPDKVVSVVSSRAPRTLASYSVLFAVRNLSFFSFFFKKRFMEWGKMKQSLQHKRQRFGDMAVMLVRAVGTTRHSCVAINCNNLFLGDSAVTCKGESLLFANLRVRL